MSMEGQKCCAADTPPTDVVSIADAARRVGVSRRTLYRAIQAGTLTKQPDGRIALADLLALGYALGPGGRSSVLAVRLLEELTAAHARERALLQQHAAELADQLAALRLQLAAPPPAVPPAVVPPVAVPPATARPLRRVLTGMAVLMLLL